MFSHCIFFLCFCVFCFFLCALGHVATCVHTVEIQKAITVAFCNTVVSCVYPFDKNKTKKSKQNNFFQDKNKYDVIIMDIADPVEAGPGICCYYKEFYQTIFDKLTEGGIFVTQSGGAGFMTYDECFSVIHNTIRVNILFFFCLFFVFFIILERGHTCVCLSDISCNFQAFFFAQYRTPPKNRNTK